MRRISKTAWIFLGVGIFVIAFAALYMLYSQEKSEYSRLQDDLTLAQTETIVIATDKGNAQSQLDSLQTNLSKLQSNLSKAKIQLENSKTGFPASVESIEYEEILFFVAERWGLQVISVAGTEQGTVNVENITFKVANFSVVVKGQVDDILGYLSSISIEPNLVSATVNSVSLTVPEEDPEGTENPTANINLTVYGY